MRPLGFLTGVVLGSAASIALVLLMVVAVFALRGRRPARDPGRIPEASWPPRASSACWRARPAAAFAGLQRERPWRWAAQALMWLLLAAIAWYYWPEGGPPGG